MSLALTLPTPAIVPVVKPIAAKMQTFSHLTVEFYREEPQNRRLMVKFTEIPYPIIVFAGTEYDAIAGIWDDQNVAEKISQMFPK